MSVPSFLLELDISSGSDTSLPTSIKSKRKLGPYKKQLELRRVPGYVNSNCPESTEKAEKLHTPSVGSSIEEYKPATIEPFEHPAPVPTSNDEAPIVIEEMNQVTLSLNENKTVLSSTPSVSKSGCAMKMADDLVDKLRRSELYRQASKEKKMEERRLLSEGLGDPSEGMQGGMQGSMIEAEVLKHVLLREQLLEDLFQVLQRESNSAQWDKSECLIAFLRAANIELMESVAAWRRMAREEGQEEKFFMYKGDNYFSKLVSDSLELESQLADKHLHFRGVFLLPQDESMMLPRELLARCRACDRMLSREEGLEKRTMEKMESKLRNNMEYIDPVAKREAQQQMEHAVVRLHAQSLELNMSQELRQRQQGTTRLSVKRAGLDPKHSVFLTEEGGVEECISKPVTSVKHVRGGLLQTDEEAWDNDSSINNGASIQSSSSLRSGTEPVEEVITGSVEVTKTPLTVDPQELMARATQDTLHFFRGIIFEVQTRLAVSEELLASKRIQAMARGGHARRQTVSKKQDKQKHEAAILIQRLHLKKASKSSRSALSDSKTREAEEMRQSLSAAVLIQSVTRGRKARNRFSLLFNPSVNIEVFESTRTARFSAQDAANTYDRIAKELGPPRRRA